MLKNQYKYYDYLHIYNIDKCPININDSDLIGIWEEEDTLLIFFHKNKDQLIKEKNFKLHFYSKIKYSDWESGKFITPFKIGEFHIVPVWYDSHNYNSKIVIDPSVVFGTGFHPTTRMILESFHRLISNEKLNSSIDLGCGTGILSIFAYKTGIKNITAIDNNNLSFEVAVKNRELNNVKMDIFKGDIFDFLPYRKDVVFANLYYHLLHDLFESRGFWESKYYFLSGFIETMEDEIITRIKGRAEIIERKVSENWVMLLLKRN